MAQESFKIMVVDDEQRNHQILKEMFADDYNIIQANSGTEALELLENNTPDAVLLDIMMPGMDGYEVCSKIKSDVKWKDLPIIFVSAKDTLDDRLRGYEAGAVDYFIKPFDHSELVAKVQHLLTYKKEFDKAHDAAQEAGSIALQAMKNSSELGVVLRFLQDSYTLKDMQSLAMKLIQTIGEFGLSCCVQFRNASDVVTYNVNGKASPLEETILTRAKDKGKIFDYKNYTIYNHELLSLIVTNMPIDDELRYGVVKDLVCYVLDGANERVGAMQSEIELEKQKIYLLRIIEYANHTMEKLNTDMHALRLKGSNVVEDMMEKMEELLPRLGLEESQETALMKIAENGINKTTAVFNEGIKVDSEFSSIMNKLQKVVDGDIAGSQNIDKIMAGIL